MLYLQYASTEAVWEWTMSGMLFPSRLWADESAVTTAEYAFLLAALVVTVVVAFANLSGEVQTSVNSSSDTLRRTSGIGCADR